MRLHTPAAAISSLARRTRVLDPTERTAEVLFGLIMVLTFTGSLSVAHAGQDDVRAMLVGALGCNIAWGIIDGALYLAGELFGRGRLRRLAQTIRDTPDDGKARAVVAAELDELFENVASETERRDLYGRIAANIRSRATPGSGGVITKEDLMGALASFWLVFFASLPAAIPFMVMDDAMLALRVSNGILLFLLFLTGYRWAKYTLGRPWVVGLCFLIGGMALVWTAIMLGG